MAAAAMLCLKQFALTAPSTCHLQLGYRPIPGWARRTRGDCLLSQHLIMEVMGKSSASHPRRNRSSLYETSMFTPMGAPAYVYRDTTPVLIASAHARLSVCMHTSAE